MENDLMLNLADNEILRPFETAIQNIMEIPDDSLNDTTISMINGMINGIMTEQVKKETVKELLNNFEELGYNRQTAILEVNNLRMQMQELISQLVPSPNKTILLNSMFNSFLALFDEALEQYHTYSFILPMTLEEGAIAPTYAHETDAAADLYAAEDTVLPAHSLSNMIKTGVHIALPEGWAALILPRSSIGLKTGLRLSNSVGLIDEEYRGQLGVIYDNHSDSDYEIKAGERIAQMLVIRAYHFKSNIVNELPTSSRGEGGFGSTGK